ncbi:arylsulfatase J-like, partial [Mercenaria mercenaria]|uniref:arylsulfatase J-like n=1 Tax=Mercenaria mercenaria TaxID=6596 RepID=UPI00234EE4C8
MDEVNLHKIGLRRYFKAFKITRKVYFRKLILAIGLTAIFMVWTKVNLWKNANLGNMQDKEQYNPQRHNMRGSGYITKPNILLIVADDLGYNDVGYHGSEIKTPYIDNLALSGIRLENYYVQPICTPTRGQLLTGRYQIYTGLNWVLRPATPSGLSLDNPTIAEKLRNSGYTTHMVGKWHVGFSKPEYLPTKRGFDSFFGFLTGHSDYYTHITNQFGRHFMSGFDLLENDQPANMSKYIGYYSTNLFADKVKSIVRQHYVDKPWFIYLSFQAVHSPLQVPEAYVKLNHHIVDSRRRLYAGMVSCMDEAIGGIVGTLKQHNQWENTLLIFTTDNGANPKAGGSNWPLRGNKGSVWEGGIRAVGFVNSFFFDQKRRGSVTNELMHVTDWFPTLINVADSNLKSTQYLDGHDQWKTIRYGIPSTRKEILHGIETVDKTSNRAVFETIFNTSRTASLRLGIWKILTGLQ